MLTSSAKYDRLRAEHSALIAAFKGLLEEWNKLVGRINNLGGERFLVSARIVHGDPSLSDDDPRKLLLLCHPDRHDGKQMAVEMTQKLLAIKANKRP
jgi:hypothetical protein